MNPPVEASPRRIGRFVPAGLAVILASLIGLQAAVAAAVPAVPALSPPFNLTHLILRQSHSSTGSGAVNLTPPMAANRTNGDVAMGLFASKGSTAGTGYLYGAVGFTFTPRFGFAGNHTLSAVWSVSWNASANGSKVCGRWCLDSIASVDATIVVEILDRTNSTWVGTNVVSFLHLSSAGPTRWSTGHLKRTVAISAFLLSGHKYWVKTYVSAQVKVGGYGGGRSVATFSLYGAYGGRLHRLSIT